MAEEENIKINKNPNLLVFLVDQMRYHSMGCAGNYQIKTPNLDQIARDGACFTNAVSNIPVCTPARACIFSGKYPLSNTVLTNNSMLPPDMPSMGKWLKNAGYATGYIGKWHMAGEAYIGETKYNNYEDGYIAPGEMRHGFDYWAVHHCSHKYWNAKYYRDNPEPLIHKGWEPDSQTDLAIDFIRNNTNEKSSPFGLVVAYGTPHTPFDAPGKYQKLYEPEEIKLRENVKIEDKHLKDYLESPVDDISQKEFQSVEEYLRNSTVNYYAAITNIDDNVGMILEELDRLQISDNTIVVFTSDHGEMLGSQGHMHKTQPWDESVLIPFLIRYPDIIKAGLKPDIPLDLPDILPTLFSLMDIPISEEVEGVDCSSILKGKDTDIKDKESAFLIWPCNAVTWGKEWTNIRKWIKGFDYTRPYRGIRTKTHTYVEDCNGPWLLYDNKNDPYQQNNLIESRGKDTVPVKLKREVNLWLKKTGDYFGSTEDYISLINLETGLVKQPEKLKLR